MIITAKQSNAVDGELPLGFGMALAKNADAMKRFSMMNQSEQKQLIAKAQNIRSRSEMQALTDSLTQST